MSDSIDEFFEAVRIDNRAIVRRLLANNPKFAKLRWPGRSGDGRMRSLGPSPFNQHTWVNVQAGHAADDSRFTSTPLIYSRDDEIVRLLVDAGADLNAKGTSGDLETPDWFYTPLWRAAHDGRLESVRLLVEHGADVNYQTPDGSNQALKTAAENDHLEVCDFLLERGAKPDIITAAMLGLEKTVASLVAADQRVIEVHDAHGRTALDAATLLDNFRICRKGLHAAHDKAAEVLIAAGAPVELEHAASLGIFEKVSEIVHRDPQIVTRPREITALLGGAAIKESPLSAARRRERGKIVSYLLQHGAAENLPTFLR